jgi:hypothetical protein
LWKGSDMRVPRALGVSQNLRDAMLAERVKPSMEELRLAMASRMDEIARLFLPGAKVTVLVRRPDDPEADVLCTSDDLPELLAMVERCRKRELEQALGLPEPVLCSGS